MMRTIPNTDPSLPPTVELTPVEARQGIMTGHMRYVLGISLVLAVFVVTLAVVLA